MPDDQHLTGLTPEETGLAAPDHAELMADICAEGVDCDPIILRLLATASLSHRKRQLRIAAEHALETGVSPVALAEQYIPAIARGIGVSWCSDTVNFATVTTACARLQSLLRDLDLATPTTGNAAAERPVVCVVIPFECYHTLGAVSLAGQLRRRGCSVRLLIGVTRGELAKSLRCGTVNAVFISIGSENILQTARSLVDGIHADHGNSLPILVGGAILPITPDLADMVGAVAATNDPDEAIELCGLKRQEKQLIPAKRDH